MATEKAAAVDSLETAVAIAATDAAELRMRLAAAETAAAEADAGALQRRLEEADAERHEAEQDETKPPGESAACHEVERERPSYCHAHVDKCSILSYDISAVLYLTGCGGGSFAFLDSDGVDRHVEPRAGRLLAFTSGVENVHRVCEVTSGERVALAMWFTLSRAHEAREDEDG